MNEYTIGYWISLLYRRKERNMILEQADFFPKQIPPILGKLTAFPIGHVDNIPTMQFFTGISRNTQLKSYAIIDWDFQNHA